jgi:hypothetical protein
MAVPQASDSAIAASTPPMISADFDPTLGRAATTWRIQLTKSEAGETWSRR